MTDSPAPEPETAPPTEKQMRLRYAGKCRSCGTSLPAGERAVYERAPKTVRCIECPTAQARRAEPEAVDAAEPAVQAPPIQAPPTEEIDAGVAGSSARREYERRRAKDEARLREKWGRFGNIAVKLAPERQSTQAWSIGAVGEEQLGRSLERFTELGHVVLHDRRIPGSRANIDHIVVTSCGVWVIDAKHYEGRPDLRVEGGFLFPRTATLTVGGRARPKLVEGILHQVEIVQGLVPDVPVRGVLCFVNADWPLIGGAFTTQGVAVMWPKRLYKLLASESEGPLDAGGISQQLVSRLKRA